MALETLVGEGDSRWEEIACGVVEIVAKQLGKEKKDIEYDHGLVKDLNADSLDSVEIIMEFEDKYDISIPEREAEKITTVRDAINYIHRVKYESQ